MTGFQEIINDPSCRGQAVLFTVPHIGDVGTNPKGKQRDKAIVGLYVYRLE
jgi:carbamoyl-phosphate synthase small subunit